MHFLGFPRAIHEQLSKYPRSCINSSQIIQGSDELELCRPLHGDVLHAVYTDMSDKPVQRVVAVLCGVPTQKRTGTTLDT